MKIICHPYSINWSAVVVDEAHKIKNPNSQITQAMKDLKCEVRILWNQSAMCEFNTLNVDLWITNITDFNFTDQILILQKSSKYKLTPK